MSTNSKQYCARWLSLWKSHTAASWFLSFKTLRFSGAPYTLGYGLDDRGSIRSKGNDGIFFSLPPRSDWHWRLDGDNAAGVWSWSITSI